MTSDTQRRSHQEQRPSGRWGGVCTSIKTCEGARTSARISLSAACAAPSEAFSASGLHLHRHSRAMVSKSTAGVVPNPGMMTASSNACQGAAKCVKKRWLTFHSREGDAASGGQYLPQHKVTLEPRQRDTVLRGGRSAQGMGITDPLLYFAPICFLFCIFILGFWRLPRPGLCSGD